MYSRRSCHAFCQWRIPQSTFSKPSARGACKRLGMTRSPSGIRPHQRGKNFRNLFFELPTVLCSPVFILFFVICSSFVRCSLSFFRSLFLDTRGTSWHPWQIFLLPDDFFLDECHQHIKSLEKSSGISRKKVIRQRRKSHASRMSMRKTPPNFLPRVNLHSKSAAAFHESF